MDLQTSERRLREERRDLGETLDHLNDQLSRSQADESGELSVVDQHIADVATDTEFRELDIMQRKVVEDRIALLDDALERLASGRFGRCVVCDREIPEGRLEAIPWTPYCLEHASFEPTPASPPAQRSRRA